MNNILKYCMKKKLSTKVYTSLTLPRKGFQFLLDSHIFMVLPPARLFIHSSVVFMVSSHGSIV